MSLPNAVLLIGHRRLRNIFGKGPDCYRGGTHCRIVSCVPDTNQKLNEALSSPIIWEKFLLRRVVIQTITEMPSTPAQKCLIMTDSIFFFFSHSFIHQKNSCWIPSAHQVLQWLLGWAVNTYTCFLLSQRLLRNGGKWAVTILCVEHSVSFLGLVFLEAITGPRKKSIVYRIMDDRKMLMEKWIICMC